MSSRSRTTEAPRRRRPAFVALAVALGLSGAALLVELGGQLYATAHPSSAALTLEPDRAVGWRRVPDAAWTWGGLHWYARDFSVDVRTNGHGFRDAPRALEKPTGVTRIALLGDSLVEGVEVPLAETAGQVLERNLNGAPIAPDARYEVLNFGVSNHGVGQGLLVWEQHARRFAPDVVCLLVAELQMQRTTRATTAWARVGEELAIRPTFGVQNGKLVRRPAPDFERLVALQQELLQSFGETRMKRRPRGSFLLDLLRPAASDPPPPGRPPPLIQDPEVLAVNYAVLRELARQVKASGARLLILDVCVYLNRGGDEASAQLRRLCREGGIGYAPLSADLLAANAAGVATRFPHDMHFNAAGHSLFARAVERWLRTQARRF